MKVADAVSESDVKSALSEEKKTSIGADSDVDYLNEIGTFLHDYIRKSSQVGRMMSHSSGGKGANGTSTQTINQVKRKPDSAKESKEILAVQHCAPGSSNQLNKEHRSESGSPQTDFNQGPNNNGRGMCFQYALQGMCR